MNCIATLNYTDKIILGAAILSISYAGCGDKGGEKGEKAPAKKAEVHSLSGNVKANVTAKSGLKLRAEPNLQSETVTVIPFDAMVKVTGRGQAQTIASHNARWYGLEYKKKTGYGYGAFLQFQKTSIAGKKHKRFKLEKICQAASCSGYMEGEGYLLRIWDKDHILHDWPKFNYDIEEWVGPESIQATFNFGDAGFAVSETNELNVRTRKTKLLWSMTQSESEDYKGPMLPTAGMIPFKVELCLRKKCYVVKPVSTSSNKKKGKVPYEVWLKEKKKIFSFKTAGDVYGNASKEGLFIFNGNKKYKILPKKDKVVPVKGKGV